METKTNFSFGKTGVAGPKSGIAGGKTRIAPTPSGYLHLGNVLSFSLTAELARRVGASILLRIDDLDQDRVNPEYVQDIFDTLNFLQIPWDEGPRNYGDYEREFSQLRRMELYRAALDQLRKEGKLFACVCSRTTVMRDSADGGYPGTCREKRLAFDSKDCNWRVRTGGAELPAAMKDYIVRKKDGFPAYQLTSVIDDLHFGVDFVVRGEDLRSSTLAQQWLALQLGEELGAKFGKIHFYHHPLLMESGDRKLSKSAGATSVRYLRQQGRGRSEIYGMIAGMLGMDGHPGSWEDLAAGYGDGKWGDRED